MLQRKPRKLTESQISEICILYDTGEFKSVELGRMFNVCGATICFHLKRNNIEIKDQKRKITPGDKFGRWIVIMEVEKRQKHRDFLCECSCVNKTRKIIQYTSLVGKTSQSCGCIKKEMMSEKEDVIGKIYNRITVISEIETSHDGRRRIMGRCSCNGNIKEYQLGHLRSGKTLSCGCLHIEKNIKRTLQVKDYQEKYPLFCKVEEIRDCETGLGIEVKCKHCREWFKPTGTQINRRVRAIERPDIRHLGREANFYCSDDCKQDCDTYHAINTPKSLRNIKTQSRCNQSVNRKALLDLQIDECGYNYCEICGKEFNPSDLIIHHNIMVGLDHSVADDMSHQILVCREHHEHKGC